MVLTFGHEGMTILSCSLLIDLRISPSSSSVSLRGETSWLLRIFLVLEVCFLYFRRRRAPSSDDEESDDDRHWPSTGSELEVELVSDDEDDGGESSEDGGEALRFRCLEP